MHLPSHYAAIVYLVAELDDSRKVSFVASKTRVAPLKTETIPRLELLSTLFFLDSSRM